MKLNILFGRSGSGKSASIRSAMQRTGNSSILLLPDQYTFEAERSFSGSGLFYAQILGFSQFSHKVFQASGSASKQFMDADGRRMALEFCIEDCRKELSIYANTGRALCEKLAEMITTLKLGSVMPEELADAAGSVGGVLGLKLRDISIIYARLRDFMADKYMDSQDANALLAQKIPDAAFLKGADVYVDNVLRFEKARLLMMKSLLTVVSSLTITLQTNGSPPDLSDFLQIAQEAGASFVTSSPDPCFARRSCPASMFLEREFYKKPSFHGALATLTVSDTLDEECQKACAYIRSLLISGARQSEITLVAPDTHLTGLRRAMSIYNIDYFLDEKRPFGSLSAVVFTLAALRAVLNGYKSEDLLIMAKSGLAFCGDEDEHFENYLLRFGIKHIPAEPFKRLSPETALSEPELVTMRDAAEKVRAELIRTLAPFSSAFKAARTAKQCASAIFNYFDSIGLCASLSKQCRELRDSGLADLAAQTAQAWSAMMKLLDQTVLLIDSDISPQRYAAVFTEGLSAHETSIIPQNVDQVEITSVSYASQRNIEHLVLVGACDGVFPAQPVGADMINDQDIQKLVERGITAFLPSLEKIRAAEQEAYSLLARAKKSLYISCTDSVSMRPSALFWRNLVSMFGPPVRVDLDCPEQGFRTLIKELKALSIGETAPDSAKDRYAFFDNHDHERLELVLARLSSPVRRIPSTLAQKLYGSIQAVSASRLEAFNECPFKHFVRFALRPEKRREFKESGADYGNYYHDIFDSFFKFVISQGIDWLSISREDVDGILAELAKDIIPRHNGGILTSDKRMEFCARSMQRKAARTLWAVVLQIRQGSFVPVMTEARIGDELPPIPIELPDSSTIALIGKIDRIDRSHVTNQVRIVDYKTGASGFSYAKLFAGSQLQLPLYALASQPLGETAGMFYLHVDDPLLKSNSERDFMSSYKLRGALLSDIDSLRAMDGVSADHSSVVGFRFSKTNESTPRDDSMSAQNMDILKNFALKKAGESASKILSGDICVSPMFVKGEAVCERCDFKSICAYDERNGERRVIPSYNKSEFFAVVAAPEGNHGVDN